MLLAGLLLTACANKGKTAASEGADSDSVAADSQKVVVEEKPDTTPQPMFVYVMSAKSMVMCYWTDIKKPKKDKDNADYYDDNLKEWTLQDGFRRNASLYTKLLNNDGKLVGIKTIGEVLKNPDGQDASYGELHGRVEIPAAGMKFALTDAKPREFGGMYVVLTDDYLASRKLVQMKRLSSRKTLPAAVVKQLEGEYKMKAEHSQLVAKNDRYSYGVLQFKGKYKTVKEYGQKTDKCLALEVVTDGDKVYSFLVEGYIIDGMYTWHADDDGEYYPSDITMFEAPKDGLEIAFVKGAPESITTGMYYIRDGKMTQDKYAVYHAMVDEDLPLWKKDIAQMQKLYLAADRYENADHKLCKYRWIDLDGDNQQEIWLRAEDDEHGAFFYREGGKWKLIATENGRMNPVFLFSYDRAGVGYLVIGGAAGGPSTYASYYEIRKSRVVHELNVLRVADEIEECGYDKKSISKEDAQKLLDAMPKEHEVSLYWHDFSQQ